VPVTITATKISIVLKITLKINPSIQNRAGFTGWVCGLE
jgi:hypothetical protein